MTTKRTKGFASLDLVLPVAPHYRTDPQILKDIEKMRTNATSRWAKCDFSNSPSGLHCNNDNASKLAALARPKIEILRANSPTLKRLLAARVKLEKYSNSLSRTIPTSRQSTRETPHEKQSSMSKQVQSTQAPIPIAQAPLPPAKSVKQTKSHTSHAHGPVDKITYEKTWTHNGNVKQKCSLEIWLPKAGLDDDDGNTTRTVTPDVNTIEKHNHIMPTVKSRRSSIVKIAATVTNTDTKSLDNLSSKKSESSVVPRVYHYVDYIMDIPEERPRSSKSVTTVKSDGAASMKSVRRQNSRPHTGRLSISTSHSGEILRFGTIEVPTSAKQPPVNVKPTSPNRETKTATTTTKPNNPSMINELMQKYSLMKKSHQELTQAKLQLQKPHIDTKTNSTINKDYSPRIRPPPIPESTSLISSDHPTVSVKKLLIETSFSRTTNEHNHTNSKLLERRSTPRKPPHSDMYPQLRVFSLANRQSSASVSNTTHLPNVNGKKSDDTDNGICRSKTLDVVLDVSTSANEISRRSDNTLPVRTQLISNRINEQTPLHIAKRTPLTLYSDQQKHNHNGSYMIQNSKPHFRR